MALLISCQQTDLQFSCNPDINQFVIENRQELEQIDVLELSTYDLALQRAIFNSWDYQKKRNAWINKLNYILANGNFNERETNHVQKLIDHVQPEYFLYQDSLKGIYEQFANEWISYAFAELNWTEEYVAFMVFRLYTDFSQLNAELSMLSQLKESIDTDAETGDCNCRVSFDYCGNAICNSGECTEVPSGCGFLWSQRCDGLCS